MNSLDKPSLKELAHFGVLGMKWGVRKERPTTPRPDDIVLDKGTKITRLTDTFNEQHTGTAYAVFKKEDVDSYLARMNVKYKTIYKAKDILISPSQKTRIDEFIKLYTEDKNVSKEMENFRQWALDSAKKQGISEDQVYEGLKTKVLLNATQKQLEDQGYKVFQASLFNSKYNKDVFIKRLSDQGYNMVIDDNDRLKTKIADSPLLIFDRTKSLSEGKTKSISSGERMGATMRTIRRVSG